VPIHAQRHLLPGWRALPREVRERWRTREEAQEDGALLCDLAWYACDGRRTLDEIARLAWLETGRHEPGFIAAFFDLAVALDLVPAPDGKGSPCSPAARGTATR
jgi:hypothetical protein